LRTTSCRGWHASRNFMSKFTTHRGKDRAVLELRRIARERVMAAKNLEKLDRRAVIGLAAAGFAAAVPAARAGEAQTRVIVDLGGIALPDEIADAMELQIRRAVLMAVAKALPHTKFKNLPLPKGARGIMLARA